MASQQAIEFAMYFRKNFSQEEKSKLNKGKKQKNLNLKYFTVTYVFDCSESEPLAIINADLQGILWNCRDSLFWFMVSVNSLNFFATEQSKCDKVIACLQPSGIQGNEESISEIEPFHSTSNLEQF